MPDTVYTRLNGYQPTGSEVNLGDRLFNGSAGVNPLLRTLAGGTPYIGPAYMAGRGVNALLHYLGKLGVFGSPTAGGTMPTNSETNNPPMYAGGDAPIAGPQQMPTNSETNNPPMYNMPGILSMWQQSPYDVYNSRRVPNSLTSQQFQFSGSRIGPNNPLTNPYSTAGMPGAAPTRGDRGLGAMLNHWGTGLSGPSADWRAELARRHQR